VTAALRQDVIRLVGDAGHLGRNHSLPVMKSDSGCARPAQPSGESGGPAGRDGCAGQPAIRERDAGLAHEVMIQSPALTGAANPRSNAH
jgi:hypothetical protein